MLRQLILQLGKHTLANNKILYVHVFARARACASACISFSLSLCMYSQGLNVLTEKGIYIQSNMLYNHLYYSLPQGASQHLVPPLLGATKYGSVTRPGAPMRGHFNHKPS